MALFKADFRGSIAGVEQFQHGFSFSSADSAAGLASDLAAAWLTVLADTDFSSVFRTDTVWSLVNVSELGATPALPIQTSAQAAIADGGTGTTANMPPQCSPVVSVRSQTAGSRARGRSYLPPMLASQLTNPGRLNTTTIGNVMDTLDTFFGTMSSNAASLVVISAVGGVYTTYPATSIQMGDVLDTQRSRRSGLAEVYTSRAV